MANFRPRRRKPSPRTWVAAPNAARSLSSSAARHCQFRAGTSRLFRQSWSTPLQVRRPRAAQASTSAKRTSFFGRAFGLGSSGPLGVGARWRRYCLCWPFSCQPCTALSRQQCPQRLTRESSTPKGRVLPEAAPVNFRSMVIRSSSSSPKYLRAGLRKDKDS